MKRKPAFEVGSLGMLGYLKQSEAEIVVFGGWCHAV